MKKDDDGRPGTRSGGEEQISPRQAGWPVIVLRLLAVVAVLIVAIVVGRQAGEDIKELEHFVVRAGAWGPVIFILAGVLLTSIMVPDTLFGVVAGVLFGLWWGTVLMVVTGFLTAMTNFWMARRILRAPFERILDKHAKLRAVQRAATEGGLRLVMLLRLAPISAVTVSYTLGMSSIRFKTFLIGCVGFIPGLFGEVYFGYVSAHVASLAANAHDHSRMHSVMVIGGFVICLVVMIYVGRMTRRALAEVAGGSGGSMSESEGGAAG